MSESIEIDFKNYYVWKGFGTSLSWWANGIKGDQEIKDYLSDLLFNPLNQNGLQLNVVRYNIGGYQKSNTEVLRKGGQVPCWERILYKKNPFFNEDFNQIYFLKKAKELGVTTFEAFSNSPPKVLTKSDFVSGSKSWFKFGFLPNYTFSDNLDVKNTQNFAEYLVNVTSFLKDYYKIPFSSISAINEPSSPGWVAGNNQEGCYYSFFKRTVLFHNLNQIKHRLKLNINISGPDENNMFLALLSLFFNPGTWGNIDQVNIHRYTIGKALGFNTFNFEDSNFLRKVNSFIVRKIMKKKLWMSEWGMGYNPGVTDYSDFRLSTHFADKMMDDLEFLKPEVWCYWQVIEDLSGNGWGCLQIPFDNPKKESIVFGAQYRAFQHFTHFIKPGNYILVLKKPKRNSKLFRWISAFDPVTKLVSVIILNKSKDYIEITHPNYTVLKSMETCSDSSLEIKLNHVKPFSLTSIMYGTQN
jgi:hypothetical protein